MMKLLILTLASASLVLGAPNGRQGRSVDEEKMEKYEGPPLNNDRGEFRGFPLDFIKKNYFFKLYLSGGRSVDEEKMEKYEGPQLHKGEFRGLPPPDFIKEFLASTGAQGVKMSVCMSV